MDLSRFRTKRENSECSTVVRRKKRRGICGEITFPTEVHPKELKKMLMGKLQSGEYTIGEMIVPKKVNRHWWGEGGGEYINYGPSLPDSLYYFVLANARRFVSAEGRFLRQGLVQLEWVK